MFFQLRLCNCREIKARLENGACAYAAATVQSADTVYKYNFHFVEIEREVGIWKPEDAVTCEKESDIQKAREKSTKKTTTLHGSMGQLEFIYLYINLEIMPDINMIIYSYLLNLTSNFFN